MANTYVFLSFVSLCVCVRTRLIPEDPIAVMYHGVRSLEHHHVKLAFKTLWVRRENISPFLCFSACMSLQRSEDYNLLSGTTFDKTQARFEKLVSRLVRRQYDHYVFSYTTSSSGPWH